MNWGCGQVRIGGGGDDGRCVVTGWAGLTGWGRVLSQADTDAHPGDDQVYAAVAPRSQVDGAAGRGVYGELSQETVEAGPAHGRVSAEGYS